MAGLWILLRKNKQPQPADIVVIYDTNGAFSTKHITYKGPNDDVHIDSGPMDVRFGDGNAPDFDGVDGHLSYTCAFVQFALAARRHERIPELTNADWPGSSVCDLHARAGLIWRRKVYFDPDDAKQIAYHCVCKSSHAGSARTASFASNEIGLVKGGS